MRARTIAPVGMVTAPALTGLCWALCTMQARRARAGGRPYTEALSGSGLVGAGLGNQPIRIAWRTTV